MTDLEQLVEMQRIHTLLANYTLTLDGHDPAGWANCFTKNGRFESGDLALVGRPTLQQYAQVHNRAFGSRHITASPDYTMDASGKLATGRSTTVVTAATRSGYKTVYAGWYEDELVKADEGWLIARRTAFTTGVPDDPDFPILTCDAELAPLVQPLLDAWEELGERITSAGS